MASTKKARPAPLIAQLPVPDKATTSMAEGGATDLSVPGDAIFDILSSVPVKSVCRFRCVSKDWRALVSDPAFVVNHKNRGAPVQLLVGSYSEVNSSPAHSGLMVMDMDGNVLWTIKGFYLMPMPIVRSSLDNLVCFCFSSLNPNTCVVDVTTGKIVFPCPLNPGGVSNSKAFATDVSLGRAAVSNLTKLVRLSEYSLSLHQHQQTCEILTLGVNDSFWRQARSPPTAVRMLKYESSSVTVNGVMHFLSSPVGRPPRTPGDSVLCFDLETEDWSKTMEGPLNRDSELWSKTQLVRLTGLNENLCMIQTEECQANIWLLVDADKSIWVKKYAIPMAMSAAFTFIKPLSVMPDGKLLLCYCPEKLMRPFLRVYDPSVGTCSDVMKLPENTFHNVRVCNLHLDCLVTPARTDGHWTALLVKHTDVLFS